MLASIFGCLLPLLLLFILFPITLLGGFVNSIFGRRSHTNNHSENRQTKKETWHSTAPQRKKRIEEDEGEYIDFEEIEEK